MTEPDAQTEWARAIASALADCGVRDVVASPGSRSTPFLLAAIAHPDLRLITIVDERSAAFYALGQAKATGRPTALLCTSGTAGAHYYPAIIEANYAHAPLIALTADRPPELQHCGAPQTIDQRHLFGAHVRWYVDLGPASASEDARRGAVRSVAQAVARASAGPVHVNAPARKPFEPAADPLAWQPSPVRPARAFAPVAHPTPAAIDALVAACDRSERGVIVAGPAPVAARTHRAAVAALAAATGYPVLAESTSQLRHGGGGPVIDAFDAMLRSPSFADAMPPDVVIQLGASPVSTGWRNYIARYRNADIVVIGDAGWHDPHNSATAVIRADVGATVAAAMAAIASRGASEWTAAFCAANAAALACAPPLDRMSEAAAVTATLAALPAGARLALSNSNPVRAVDAFAPARSADLSVLSQRGASGIDGLIAGAAGAASTGDAPTALLVGDVAFSHDIGSLAVAARATSPLALVVLDNAGGRIFEQLPIARVSGIDAALTEHWLTPTRIEIDKVADGFGIHYARATRPAELQAALTEAVETPRASVIHAVLPANAVTDNYRRMWSNVDAAIRAQLGSRAGGTR